ncbi:MAG: hypothetical protein Pars2KO_32220 [Parasphingorhabdus sp.]
MPAQNSLMQFAIKELDSNFAKRLGRIVKKLADGQEDDNLNQNRRKLFFEIEPFAREFDEYPTEPLVRENYDEYAEWINRRLNSVKGQGLKKYRAMFFGWLCYYHRDEAEGLIKDFDAELPLYIGHPELNECSEEAKLRFRRQEPPKEISTPASIVINKESEGIDGDMSLDNEPDIETSSTKVKKLPRAVLAMVGAALLAGTGIALYSSGLFQLPKIGSNDIAASNETDIKPDTDVEEAMPETEAEDDIPIEDGDAKEDKGSDEKTAQEASPPPTTKQVNPVWDKISASDWSVKPLRNFRALVQKADRVDLISAANNGNVNAQALAGIGYHLGEFGSTNHTVGLRDYLRPACGADHGRACALVGAHYGQPNMGVRQNEATARTYYARACQLGNQMGCYLDGVRYLSTFGKPQDTAKGYAQLGSACDAGVVGACAFAMVGYSKGVSIKPNLSLAKRYYLRAQGLGDRLSQKPFEQWLEEQRYYWGQPSTFRPQKAQQ